jgi:two-component system, NtrC family, nitrogen regulation response regulator NtrX
MLLRARYVTATMTCHYSILIIADDDNLRHTLGIILEHAGCSVAAAATGQDALLKLQQLSFDLILLDFDMLDTNGQGLLSELRQSYSRIPVIVLTGQNYPNLAGELRELGVRSYLPKPVDPDCILAQVYAPLTGRSIPDSVGGAQPGSKSLNGSELPVENGRAPTEAGETKPPSPSL